jgi:tetratricopeptide (TPR) repeat protein
LNPELAEKYFRTAVAIDSRFGAAWANLVYHLHFSGRLDDAIRTANDGVRQLPGSSGVIRARSTAFLYAGRLDDAERDVRGIAPEQQSTQDRVVLASVALMRGDAAHASAEFADIGRATPEPALELMIARSYFITGRLDEAMKHVDTAVALDSSCARFAATTPAFARYRDAAPFRERLARWQSTQ